MGIRRGRDGGGGFPPLFCIYIFIYCGFALLFNKLFFLYFECDILPTKRAILIQETKTYSLLRTKISDANKRITSFFSPKYFFPLYHTSSLQSMDNGHEKTLVTFSAVELV